MPLHKIQHFIRVVPHQQAIDRKVPPLHVLFGCCGVLHAIRVAPIRVADIRTECGYLHLHAILRNQDHSELRTHRDALELHRR